MPEILNCSIFGIEKLGLSGSIAKTITLENILSHDYTEIDAYIEKKLKEAGLNIKSSYVRLNLNPPLDYVINKKDDAIVIGNITV